MEGTGLFSMAVDQLLMVTLSVLCSHVVLNYYIIPEDITVRVITFLGVQVFGN